MNKGKIRIYELSKELELENRDILAICEKLDIAVKSHSSTILKKKLIALEALLKAPTIRLAPLRQSHPKLDPPVRLLLVPNLLLSPSALVNSKF